MQIRKNTTETADKHEVDQLRGEVKDLRNALMKVNDDVVKLKTLVELLVKTKEVSSPDLTSSIYESLNGNKKRKVTSFEYPTSVPSLSPLPSGVMVPDSIGLLSDTTNETFNEEIPMAVTSEPSIIPLPALSSGDAMVTHSSDSEGTMDDKWSEMLNITPAAALSSRTESVGTTVSSTFDDEMLMSSLLNMGDDDEDEEAFFDNL
jgi:hypothetical protein